MKTNKILSTKISDILLQQSIVEEPAEIIKSIDRYLNVSEQMLRELSLIRVNINSNERRNKNYNIYKFEEQYNIDIEQIEAIISSSEESGIRDQSNYRKLQHNYYKIQNAILNCKNLIFTETMKTIDKKLSLLENKSEGIEGKFEGIGSTILSTIVSLTVVVTAITAIDRIYTPFIPVYLLGIVWLGMTFIIFVNNLFNKSDFNSKQATTLYGVITILFMIILLWSVGYVQNNNIEIFENNCQESQS